MNDSRENAGTQLTETFNNLLLRCRSAEGPPHAMQYAQAALSISQAMLNLHMKVNLPEDATDEHAFMRIGSKYQFIDRDTLPKNTSHRTVWTLDRIDLERNAPHMYTFCMHAKSGDDTHVYYEEFRTLAKMLAAFKNDFIACDKS